MSFRNIFVIPLILNITACQHQPEIIPDIAKPVYPIRNVKNIVELQSDSFITYPALEQFSVCYGHTCNSISNIGLQENEWRDIEAIFTDNEISNPVEERVVIGRAIAEFEKIVGKYTGTSEDLGQNSAGAGLPGQLDCVDETINTTVYLSLFQNNQLLKWHTVDERISRGIMSLQKPHFTAVILDKSDNTKYAVDSWFRDNGEPPYIVPLNDWKAGWNP